LRALYNILSDESARGDEPEGFSKKRGPRPLRITSYYIIIVQSVYIGIGALVHVGSLCIRIYNNDILKCGWRIIYFCISYFSIIIFLLLPLYFIAVRTSVVYKRIMATPCSVGRERIYTFARTRRTLVDRRNHRRGVLYSV